MADLASVYSAAQQLRLSQENVATLVKALPGRGHQDSNPTPALVADGPDVQGR